MIIKTEQLADACKKILSAVDTGISSVVNETLEIKAEDKVLSLSVTNKEYFVTTKINLDVAEQFRAVVDATLFLNLVSKVTTDNIELSIKDTTLVVKANGTYKFPMIYIDSNLLVLPQINIDNKTLETTLSSEILSSIYAYNLPELNKGNIVKPIQKMFYVDEKGCITFTSGACANYFTLEKPMKILLSQKVVKLFKLFKDSDVKFTLGYDEVNGVVMTKVCFENDATSLTAILASDASLLNSVPANAIRGRAETTYPNTISINKSDLIHTIDRLLLFNSVGSALHKTLGKFIFKTDGVSVFDIAGVNEEFIKYDNTQATDAEYSTILDLADLKMTLDSVVESHVTLHYGNHQAVVLARGNVKNVIPEIYER